jgi:hypothetical protein
MTNGQDGSTVADDAASGWPVRGGSKPAATA